MKVKLSQYTPSQPKEDLITPEVSALTKITLENICLELYVIHVMKKDTLQEIVLRNRIRKRETKEDIILMLQRMMNHPRKEPDKKVNILQARVNMF